MIKRNKLGQFVKGGNSPRSGIYKSRKTLICKICGKTYNTYHSKSNTCSIKCRNKFLKKKWSDNLYIARQKKELIARNTKKLDAQGYVLIYMPEHPHCTSRKYIREHRLVIESHIGRYLNSSEKVHHIDGNKLNNSINNLMLFKTQSEHITYHHNS